MRFRHRKSLLWIPLVMMLLVSMTMVNMPVYAPGTMLAVDPPTKVDMTLTPGSTFSIEITVADVMAMWGYDFFLSYDTFVLTATDYGFYDPFVTELPSEINDEEGYVALARGMVMMEEYGFDTVDPAPIAWIEFTVDALGESVLDLHDTVISDIYAEKIDHEAVDGYFRNVDPASIPTAEFTFTPLEPIEREEITFNASASTPNGGAIANYTWVFGDGTNVTETDPITTHNYTWRGTYTVTLAVFDNEDTGIVDTIKHNVTVLAHDIAVTLIKCSRYSLPNPDGRNVTISVTVKNEGHFTETFDVTIYRNTTAIETWTDISLTAGADTTLTFTWDTTGFAKGNYTISANATVVPYEYDTADNTYPKPDKPIIVEIDDVHDVAVSKVTASPTVVTKGETVSIHVTVENVGHFTETFDTTAYYNSYLALSPNGNGAYTDWEGDYTDWDDWPSHDGDVTFVGATSTEMLESSTLTDHTDETWNIERVIVNIVARNNETSSNEQIKPILVIDGVEYTAETEYTLTTNYEKYTYEWPENPATREAWNWSAIDALEAGVRSVGFPEWTGQLMVTQLYVEVLGVKRRVAPEETKDLSAGADATLTFTWGTTVVSPGKYAISANITKVTGEVYTADNTFADGVVTVEKRPGAPSASFTFTPLEPTEGEEITFNASASEPNDGEIVKYIWDFGDGTTEIYVEGVNLTAIATHDYDTAKTYTVTLNVTNSEGESDAIAQTVTVYSHDLAILSFTLSDTEMVVGGSVNIRVIVLNDGHFTETFNVKTYYNVTATEWAEIGKETRSLDAGDITLRPIWFYWNTTDVPIGTYTVKAEVPPVSGETDTADNTRTITVTIIPVLVHDIAVTNVTASPTEVAVGDSVSISVTVENQGNFTETFDVNVKYDDTDIRTQTGISLGAGATQTLTFTWDTTGVDLGTYTITANASVVSGETDTADNTRTGTVTVKLGSTISISATPTTVTIGETTTISGSITPTREGVTVTIWYKLIGEENWNKLTTVQTNGNSQYSFDWTPETAGTYEVKASWAGDASTLDAESDPQTITVKEAPETPGFLLYAVAGIAIVIVVATVLVYFLRARKPT